MSYKILIVALVSSAFFSALQFVRAEASMQSDQLETLTSGCRRGEPEQCSQLFDHLEKSRSMLLIATFESLCPVPGDSTQRFYACLQLARAYFINSKYQSAANVFSKYCKKPGHQICAYYGSSLFHAGNQIQGWTVIRNYALEKKLVEHCNAQEFETCYEVACLHSLHSQVSGSAHALSRAEWALRIAAEKSPDFEWDWAMNDPDLEPLRKLGILEKIRSEQVGSRVPASTEKREKKTLISIYKRSTIDALVREVKRTEEGMELLKPEFYAKAYTTEFRCNQKKLILLSDFDISLPDSIVKTEKRGFPLVGSGGHQLRIFLEDERGKLKPVWNRVVIGILEFRPHGSCPDLLVYLHGGEFDRAGNAYGVGRLRFHNGKFSLLMRNGKVVEEKDY